MNHRLSLILVSLLCWALTAAISVPSPSSVGPVVGNVVSTAARVGKSIARGLKGLLDRTRGTRLDPAFADKAGVVGSSEHLTRLETIIDELTKENEILRQQGFIYKKNVQYHKDIAARLRREKEAMRVALESIKKETTAELTRQFLKEKEELMKELQSDFDKKSKAMKLELKDAKIELKNMAKELDSAVSGSKQGITVIKAELREVSGKLTESEALVKTLQISLKEKDKQIALQKEKATAAKKAAPVTPASESKPKTKSKAESSEGGEVLKASSGSSSGSGRGSKRTTSAAAPRAKTTKIASSSKRAAK